MSDIHLELMRSGGFAGLSLPALVLNTSDLPPSSADEVAYLVATAESTFEPTASERGIPDAMSYVLTLRVDGRVRRLHFNDADANSDLRQLVARIHSDGTSRAG